MSAPFVEDGTCLNNRHVCDGGDVGCSSRRRARSNMSILQGLPTKKCAPEQAFVPALRYFAQGRRATPSWPLCGAPSVRVVARTGVCFVARLDHIDRLAPELIQEA